MAQAGCGLAIVDGPLTPIQQRNLERAWDLKVLDRSGLILEIFGERAQSAEGRVQVEHAHLTYQKTRLVRSWTHLERQRGGFGFLGGPGESQIEVDRRMIDARLRKLDGELERIRRERKVRRSRRVRRAVPTVALVGYTNAGKSTLFNRLCGANVTARSMPFTTLDPTVRRLRLPNNGPQVAISDTVGFISDLPTELIAAFRATLDEVVHADVILHVIDAFSEERNEQRTEVLSVLQALEVGKDRAIPILEIYNKIDLLDAGGRAALGTSPAVSAQTGEGIDGLLARLAAMLQSNAMRFAIVLRPEAGEAVAWLYRRGAVCEYGAADASIAITAMLETGEVEQFRNRFGATIRSISRADAAQVPAMDLARVWQDCFLT